MNRSAAVATLAVLVALAGFVGYRVGVAVPAPVFIDRAPAISWTTPQLEQLLGEHGCTREWSDWPAATQPLGAVVGVDAGVEHVPFGEGWAALVDLDDGRNLVAVCTR